MSRDHQRVNIFRPCELAPVSGVYRVVHLTRHRDAHPAVIIRGEELPMCRNCKMDVEFEVVQAASHLTHDWDFAGPTSLSIKQVASEYANLRTYPRKPVTIAVEVEGAATTAGMRGHTVDISEGGICALLNQRLDARDALVTLRIEVPRANTPLLLGALLRYRAGNRHGFLFTDIDANARQVVRAMFDSSAR